MPSAERRAYLAQQTRKREAVSKLTACELASVSVRTMDYWMATGKVEYVRTAGGAPRIFVDTLWRDPT